MNQNLWDPWIIYNFPTKIVRNANGDIPLTFGFHRWDENGIEHRSQDYKIIVEGENSIEGAVIKAQDFARKLLKIDFPEAIF
ncbi:MAG: hypothetical protein ACKVQW_08660 [Pyrinomonadaceae bacterium]